MDNKSLFTGFTAFSEVTLPEGALKLQYGLSTQVIEIQAEVAVAPESGVTPRQLAEKYARMFNMPVDGLVAYADGVEIPFGDPIPQDRTITTIEFRQPSGEKGTGRLVRVIGEAKIVPLGEDTVTVRVYRRDTVDYQRTREEVLGAISTDLLPSVELKGSLVALSAPAAESFTNIGWRITETLATRPVFVFEVEMTRTAGKYDLGDVFKTYPGAEVRVNGKDPAEDRLEPGDLVEVVVPGEAHTADFETWAAEMRQLAVGHYGEALENRANAISARRTELEAEPWMSIRAMAKSFQNIVAGGKGVTKASLVDKLLKAEFPTIKQDEFIASWLRENAPEVLEA